MSTKSKDLATSLFKALDVLTVLGAQSVGVSIGELVDTLGLPRSSLVRILNSLIYYGFVSRSEDRKYSVTDDFRSWRSEGVGNSLVVRYQPLMRRICEEVGEMVVLGRLEGRNIKHLHYEEPNQRVRVVPPVNRKFELRAMAMGKLAISVREDLMPKNASGGFMKEIELVRKQGYAWNRGESEEGIIAWGTWLEAPSPLSPMLAVTWPDFRFNEDVLGCVKRALREIG